jgi:hypothetical protein
MVKCREITAELTTTASFKCFVVRPIIYYHLVNSIDAI